MSNNKSLYNYINICIYLLIYVYTCICLLIYVYTCICLLIYVYTFNVVIKLHFLFCFLIGHLYLVYDESGDEVRRSHLKISICQHLVITVSKLLSHCSYNYSCYENIPYWQVGSSTIL